MSRARALVAALATSALVLPLTGTTAPSSGRALQASTVGAVQEQPRTVHQRGRLVMLPQLAQPGQDTQRPLQAKSSMRVKFRPARPGRVVMLQRRKDARWVEVKRARQNGRGLVEFNAPYRRGGTIQKYRAVALRYQALRRQATNAERTDTWGRPDLNDTFTGSALPDHWEVRDQEYEGNRACSMSSPRTARVARGRLRLTVRRDWSRRDDPKCKTEYGRFDWRLTGHVSTQGQRAVSHGIAAARIKFQRRRGQHGAFWMLPTEPDQTRAEIDVAEWFGNRHPQGGLSSFVHFTDTDGVRKKVGPEGVRSGGQFIRNTGRYGDRWAGKYHVFSVEWTPKRYVFRIDGKETFRTRKGVSQVPAFLILSLQASIYEIPYLDGDPAAPHSSARLPQHMQVDWVRYWDR